MREDRRVNGGGWEEGKGWKAWKKGGRKEGRRDEIGVHYYGYYMKGTFCISIYRSSKYF